MPGQRRGSPLAAGVATTNFVLRLLGGRVQQLIPVELPRIPETRYLVVLEKTAATPPEYPRRAGMPARDPLG